MAQLPDFDDEPTVIQVRPEDLADEPPPLPFNLARCQARDEDWLADIPEAARRVLEDAARPAESWPRGGRIEGAVAQPLTRIPSLSVRRHA